MGSGGGRDRSEDEDEIDVTWHEREATVPVT